VRRRRRHGQTTLGIARAHANEAASRVASVKAGMRLTLPALPHGRLALRVGFIMADFRQHVTPLIRNLKPKTLPAANPPAAPTAPR
jgi:hypothetical protein